MPVTAIAGVDTSFLDVGANTNPDWVAQASPSLTLVYSNVLDFGPGDVMQSLGGSTRVTAAPAPGLLLVS